MNEHVKHEFKIQLLALLDSEAVLEIFTSIIDDLESELFPKKEEVIAR